MQLINSDIICKVYFINIISLQKAQDSNAEPSKGKNVSFINNDTSQISASPNTKVSYL